MRLTLRTLLAYLDDVLPPAETALLQKRIEESEFAATLVRRISHAVRRMRLSAPKIEGRGIGFDANSVADYLDSVLPTERMAEFERVCLESDVHLAEVAACHQILCKVLKEPAHVTPELKNRIHSLPDLVKSGKIAHSAMRRAAEPAAHPEASPNQASAAQASPAPVAPAAAIALEPEAKETVAAAVQKPVAKDRPKPEVPDYLKPEPSHSRWQLIGILAFMGIAAMVLLLMSPLGRNILPFANLFGPAAVTQNPQLPPSTPSDSNADATPPPEPIDEKTNPSPLDKLKPFVEEVDPAKKAEIESSGPPEPEEAPAAVGPLPKKPATPPDAAPNKPANNDAPPDPNPETKTPPAPENPATTSEPMLGDVGKYISDETVLARYDQKSKNWMRIAPRSLVQGGEKIVSLPISRPQIALSSGVQVTLVGEAGVVFDRGVSSPIALQAEHGKFLFVTAGVPGATIELNMHKIRGQLALASADAEAAVEVFSFLPPGEDPALGTSYAVVCVYCLSGSVSWRSGTGEPEVIKTGHVRVLIADRDPMEKGPIKLPNWVDARKTPVIERDAAKIVEPLLPLDRPLVLALEELANHRRIEVRTYVARSLASLQYYHVILRHLSEEEYRAYWHAEIDTLRAQVARGGDVAAELQSQIQKLRGMKDGDLLYRLLWGFNEEQLLGPEAENLVALLEDIHPDIRLLAFDNLKRITGLTHSYNPAYTPDKNRSALVRWSKARKEGEIAYAVKPSPIADLQLATGKSESGAEK